MISLIVAASENNVIGREGGLPWDLPDDLQYFKEVTSGYPIIMGRKNFESIGRPLPNRQNIIITRQSDFEAEGCDVVPSLEEAFAVAGGGGDIFVIGGGQIYEQTIGMAGRIYLTRVHAEIDGDVFFPVLGDEWKEVSSKHHDVDEKHAYPFTFFVYDRE